MAASIDDLISKATTRTRPHRDVTITLDRSTSERIEALEEQLASEQPDARLADPRGKQLREEIDRLREEAAEAVITFRIEALPGDRWVELIGASIARPNIPADRAVGYNVEAVCKAAAVESAGRLEDGTVERLTAEQWGKLWPLLSGYEAQTLIDAILDLNDWSPRTRPAEAKKDSSAGSGTSST